MKTFEGRKVVLSALVGSWAYNLNTPLSDKDYKHFVTPTFDDLYSGKMFATSSVSDTLDYDVHDIRRLAELLWKANLSFVAVLFPREITFNVGLAWMFENADSLAHMNLPYLYNSTMGMHRQKMATLLKGTGNTQDLIDKYGYDTKQACHAMRCLYVLERVADGMSVRDALWMEDDSLYRYALLNIKGGLYTLETFHIMVNYWMEDKHERVESWFKSCLPNEPVHEMLKDKIKEFVKINLEN